MPPMEEAFLTETALLFVKTGVDRFNEPTVADPVEIDVRFELDRREVIGDDGTPIAVDAAVVVNREVAVGDRIWLGDLSSWYGTGTAGTDTEVMEVVAFSRVKDVKGRVSRKTAGLRRFKDEGED